LTDLLTSQELKSYTRSSHQELEKILIGKMLDIQNEKQYVELLQLFYNYFSVVEEQINLYIGPAELEDHLQRRKTKMLQNDIATMGGSVKKMIVVDDIPVFSNHLQAFGGLYVLEGSTLGGSHISLMIRKQLQKDDDAGFSFFNSYGDQTMAMWAKFKIVLDRQATNRVEQNLILQSADETFLKFKSWIEKTGILN
jgi:heme oxygenase